MRTIHSLHHTLSSNSSSFFSSSSSSFCCVVLLVGGSEEALFGQMHIGYLQTKETRPHELELDKKRRKKLDSFN